MKGKFPNGLKAAMDAQGKGPTELASAVGATKQDISRWASGERKLPAKIADQLARHLHVSANKLLLIDEPENYLQPDGIVIDPYPDLMIGPEASWAAVVGVPENTRVALNGFVSAGGSIDTSSEQGDPNDCYDALLQAYVLDACEAYQVVGMSMYPSFKPDSLIICGQKRFDYFERFVGEEVVVECAAGDRYLKVLHPSGRSGLYNLESYNAPLMHNVAIISISEIVAIIPAKKWTRIRRRGHGYHK